MVGHDAVADDRVVVVKSQDFIPSDHREFGYRHPTATICRAGSDRNDAALTVEDLVGQVVFSTASHGGIVLDACDHFTGGPTFGCRIRRAGGSAMRDANDRRGAGPNRGWWRAVNDPPTVSGGVVPGVPSRKRPAYGFWGRRAGGSFT